MLGDPVGHDWGLCDSTRSQHNGHLCVDRVIAIDFAFERLHLDEDDVICAHRVIAASPWKGCRGETSLRAHGKAARPLSKMTAEERHRYETVERPPRPLRCNNYNYNQSILQLTIFPRKWIVLFL